MQANETFLVLMLFIILLLEDDIIAVFSLVLLYLEGLYNIFMYVYTRTYATIDCNFQKS